MALLCGREMVGRVGPYAFGKRMKGEGEEHPTVAEAWVRCRRTIYKLIQLETDEKNTGGAKS